MLKRTIMHEFVDLSLLNTQVSNTSGGETIAQQETRFYDYKAELEKSHIERLNKENKARINFSEWIFGVTVFWMLFILMIVICCGQGGIKLSDTVLVTLITTTTANVFGFLYVVVNYLFNKDKST